VPLTFLTASTQITTSNIERLLSEFKITQKAIYLPPKNLQDADNSLLFISETQNLTLPQPHETKTTELFSDKPPNNLFLTPPGDALTRLFEQELGGPFTKINIKTLNEKLLKITENLGLFENIAIGIEKIK
jgi:hypothetical protein